MCAAARKRKKAIIMMTWAIADERPRISAHARGRTAVRPRARARRCKCKRKKAMTWASSAQEVVAICHYLRTPSARARPRTQV